MSLIVLCGIPGSGKTTLANNIAKKLKDINQEYTIVSEPSVESGAFESSKTETTARSTFKSAVQRDLSANRVVIADGMNFIKGFRYELFCFAREQGLNYLVAFCDGVEDECKQRSGTRYTQEKLTDLMGRMERPCEKNRWDRPLFIVKDPNDQSMIDSIIMQAMAKNAKLAPKKATTAAATTNSHVNDQVDQITNDFCTSLLKIQTTVPLGSTVKISGAEFRITRIFNPSQLKRARREFASRAKGLSADANMAQIFAESLDLVR